MICVGPFSNIPAYTPLATSCFGLVMPTHTVSQTSSTSIQPTSTKNNNGLDYTTAKYIFIGLGTIILVLLVTNIVSCIIIIRLVKITLPYNHACMCCSWLIYC